MENKPQLLTEFDGSDGRELSPEELALLKIEEANRKWVEEHNQRTPAVNDDEYGRETF